MAVGGSGNDPGGSGSGGFGPGAGGGWGGGANNNQGSGGSMGSSGSGPSGGGGWGGHGGGGGNGGGGNSGNGSNVGTAAAEAASKGRRDTASTSFGGLVGAAEKGLGLAERGPSELGEVGWSASGHESRAAAADLGQERGAQMAMDASGLNTVGSIAGGKFGLGIKGFTTAAEKGMTADEQRGYDAVQSQKTGFAGLGPAAAGLVAGPAVGALASLGIAAVDHSRQAAYAQSEFGINPSQGRRDTATQSFSSGGSGSNRSSNLASSPTSTPVSNWQPSTIGFGEYDSHLKGLLS